MNQDRRQSSRYPALFRTIATVGRERFDVVCTDTSPTGAFFTTRNPPPVGAEVSIELRAGGVDSPMVVIQGVVTRTTLMGSSGPIGFGAAWRAALCENGPEPLFRVLRLILHMAVLGDADLTQGRLAQYVFPQGPGGPSIDAPRHLTPRNTPSSPAGRPSSVHQALGVWSSPVHRGTGSTPRDAQGPDTARQPAQHPVELEPQAAVVAIQPPVAVRARDTSGLANARTSGPAQEGTAAPGTSGPDDQAGRHSDRSQVFDGLQGGVSVAVGGHAEGSSQSADDASQSWPVYALAPGERRQVSDPNAAVTAMSGPHKPVQAPTARHASGGFAEESIGARDVRDHVPVSRHPIVASSNVPSSKPFDASLDPTDPSDRHQAHARKAEGARMLVAADVPVTFLRQNQFVPGHLVGIAEQLACVVTLGEAPDLDEQLVIHLPVRFDHAWRTVQLSGKLLQVATDTAAGKRFVMHIERTEEGRHKGAFAEFLRALHGP